MIVLTMIDAFLENQNVRLALIQYMLYSAPGLYSQSDKTSYHIISWSIEAASLDVVTIVLFWNLKDISVALRCLSNFRAIGDV